MNIKNADAIVKSYNIKTEEVFLFQKKKNLKRSRKFNIMFDDNDGDDDKAQSF